MMEEKNSRNETTDDSAVSVIVKRSVRKRKKRAAIIRNTAITVACVILGIIISIQYKSLSAAESMTSSDADKITSLQAQQLKLIQENEGLLTANKELADKVEMLENATNEEQIKKLEEELNKIKLFSGTTKVQGSGVNITIVLNERMADAVLQRHLLTIVNELKASTAQAISINEERITAMTEIRVVGSYVMINGRQYSANRFEIKAIGQPQDLRSGVLLNDLGPLAIMQKEKGCSAECVIKDDIVINECKTQDIVTELLRNVE